MASVLGDDWSNAEDAGLVQAARDGSRSALETLVRRHQPWIYNIAFRMVGRPEDAEDVTQDVLVKMITGLATYRGDSAFRTWLYRIAANHVLNMKHRVREHPNSTFSRHGDLIDNAPELELPEDRSLTVESRLLVEETKVGCMMGMLLCLNRTQRIVFILGAILDATTAQGSELTGLSAEAYRQTLSRARRELGDFLEAKCGVVNPANACRCSKKTGYALKAGFIDARNLRFADPGLATVRQRAARCAQEVSSLIDPTVDAFRGHPFLESPDFVRVLESVLEGRPAGQ